jgi:hypothetical protein
VVMKQRERGRPAISASKRRSRSITFRVLPRIFSALQRSARAAGISLSDEITNRIDAGGLDENAQLLKDLGRAMRMVGDWKADKDAAARLRTVARILIDARLGGEDPGDLLGVHRGRSTTVRMMAHVILNDIRP